MKTALAIVCSLLLLGTQLVQLRAAGAGEVRSAPACCDCNKSRCCSTGTPRPESQPVSATPAFSFVHGPLLAPASTTLLWTLPAVESAAPAVSSSAPFSSGGTSLYARNCARLI